MAPITRYARSGEASIAYQVTGEGTLDLLFMPGWISQIEQLWEASAVRRFLERLAVFNRLILFDRRGSGLSDSAGQTHTLEQEARDSLHMCFPDQTCYEVISPVRPHASAPTRLASSPWYGRLWESVRKADGAPAR